MSAFPAEQPTAFEDLCLIERALILALQIPYAVGPSERRERYPQPGESAPVLTGRTQELAALLRANFWNFDRLMRPIRGNTGDLPAPDSGFRAIDTWYGRPSHAANRQGLIDVLIASRAHLLVARRRVLPESESTGRVAHVQWHDLTEREQLIVAAIGSGQLTRKQVAAAVKVDDGTAVQRPLTSLVKRGVLKRTSGAGYAVVCAPIGAPASMLRPQGNA